jgi:hypothetical protein
MKSLSFLPSWLCSNSTDLRPTHPVAFSFSDASLSSRRPLTEKLCYAIGLTVIDHVIAVPIHPGSKTYKEEIKRHGSTISADRQ